MTKVALVNEIQDLKNLIHTNIKDGSHTKKRGAKVCAIFDGEWNEELDDAAEAFDTSKRGYVEEATRRRLVDDGFDPRKRNRDVTDESTRERVAAAGLADQS
jgi:hypothetical protein